jgi:hypothetical protein
MSYVKDYSKETELRPIMATAQVQGLSAPSAQMAQAVEAYAQWASTQDDPHIAKKTHDAGWILWNNVVANIDQHTELGSLESDISVRHMAYTYSEMIGELTVSTEEYMRYGWGEDGVGQSNHVTHLVNEVPDQVRQITERQALIEGGIKLAQLVLSGLQVELERTKHLRAIAEATEADLVQVLEANASVDGVERQRVALEHSKARKHYFKPNSETVTELIAQFDARAPRQRLTDNGGAWLDELVGRMRKHRTEDAQAIAQNRIAYAKRAQELAEMAEAKKAEAKARRAERRAERLAQAK